ncbi:MAG: hypothetical protein ACOX7J_06655 [Bacillota bacterium]
MHWWYKFIERDAEKILYSYSCENKDLDGVIAYYPDTKEAEIIKASDTDKGIERRIERSLSHFFIVVRENFPEERHVCCG